MANQFLADQTYSNVFLLLLKNQLQMGKLVDGRFSKEITDRNGRTISIKKPPQFVAKSGESLQVQDMVVGSTNVSLNQYKNVHIDVGDLEDITSFNELIKSETMKSAASTLAHDVNNFLADLTLDFYGTAGTVGETIKTSQQFNKVHTQLMAQGVPNADLSSVVSFEDGELIRGQLTGTDISGINRNALQKTRIPILSEIDLFATQALPTYTAGDRVAAATTLIDGAAQNVNYRDVKDTGTQSLVVDGQGSGVTMKRGETFTIAGVFSYDNRSQKPSPNLQVFTITADVTTAALGAVTLTISPAMIVPGTNDGVGTDTNTAFATVTAAPAENAVITHLEAADATIEVRSAFHKRAITMVSAQLRKPFTGVSSFQSDKETGIAIRYWRGSDISTGRHVHRFDMVYGGRTIQPALGARAYGAP